MIELVIKIPEKVYNAVTHIEFDANLVVNEMRNSISSGTPIPKGHGRVIDESKIKKCGWNFIGHHAKTDAPTIIEADTAESEE